MLSSHRAPFSPKARRWASLLALLAVTALSGCHKSSSTRGSGTPNPIRLQDVNFLSRQEINVGAEGLRAVLVADFSGNGALDLISSSIIDERLVFQAASTAGVFTPQQTAVMNLPSAPGTLISGDFDGDQDLDFAAGLPLLGEIAVWRNDGLGGFTQDTSNLSVGNSLSELIAYDANGDGFTDIVAARGATHLLSYFAGSASGFAAPVTLQGGTQGFLAGLAQGDLDADGFPELLVCNGDENQVLVYPGSAQGPATSASLTLDVGGSGVLTAAVADMDKDGKLDLVTACYGCGSVVFFPGDGTGKFGAAQTFQGDGKPFHISIGDVDADGNLDAIVSYLDRAAIGFLPGNGAGSFGAERQFGTTGLPTMSVITDLDKDGNLDVLTSGLDSMFLSWLRGLGADGIQGAEHFGTGHEAPNFTIAADFDADGHADALVSDRLAGVVTLLPGSSDGRFGAPAFEAAVGNLPGNLSKGDFDRDGRIDAVVPVSNGLRFLLNRSSQGNFAFDLWPAASQAPFQVGTGPFEVHAVDTNGDSALDLVLSDFGGDRVLVVRGLTTGFGFDPTPFEIQVPGGPLGLVVSDFNQDGAIDAAVSRFHASFVSILRGDGAGEFSLAAELPTGPSPNYLKKADFDGNGTDDLVVSNLEGTQLTLFFSQAIDSWISSAVRVGDGPTALLARDLDRDNKADILVASSGSADFHVLIGDGSGGFPIAKRFPGTWGALSADLADVDGDGLDDFVIASLFANRVSLYLNRSK